MNYLKITGVIIFFLFFSNASSGQLYIGPKGGIGLTNLKSSSDLITHETKAKFFQPLFGVVAEKPIIGGFSVQLEAQLSSKGSNLEATNRGFPIFDGRSSYSDRNRNGEPDEGEIYTIPDLYESYNVQLSYIEIPLLFKYEFFAGALGYFVEVGPTYGIGLKGTATPDLVDAEGNTDSKDLLLRDDGINTPNYNEFFDGDPLLEEINLFEPNRLRQLKKSDFGLSLGGGLAFDIGLGRLYVDARYVLGLKNLNARSDSSTLKNNALQISTAYVFPIGGY